MSAQEPEPPTRFFARLRAADISCPGCGRVEILCVTTAKGVWDRRVGKFTCPECREKFYLGVVAWDPGKAGARKPAEDQVPTLQEAMGLRAVLSVYAAEKRGKQANKKLRADERLAEKLRWEGKLEEAKRVLAARR